MQASKKIKKTKLAVHSGIIIRLEEQKEGKGSRTRQGKKKEEEGEAN